LKNSFFPTAIDQIVGENLRLHRSRNRLSAAELARSIGVEVQQIDLYERGLQSIPAHRLLYLAEILSVHFSAFFNAPKLTDEFVRPALDQSIHN
jgi:transcriptional regulator with XRE-family HTH domain